MSNKSSRITEAEWPIMKVLWERNSATAAEICAEVARERAVTARTVKTLIRRLVGKDLVAFSVDPDDSRVYHYRALISRAEGIDSKNQHLLNLVYENRAGSLLTHFLKNTDLSREEIAELQRILKDKEENSGE